MDIESLPAIIPPPLLAEFLHTTKGRLAQDRYLGRGVPYVKFGKNVRYMKADLLKYLQSNRIGDPDA